MPKPYPLFVLLILAALMASCAVPVPGPPDLPVLPDIHIVRHPAPVDYSGFNVLTSHPVYDPDSNDYWQVDLRSSDLTKLDLSKSTNDLLYADFDSKTQWPASYKMPADFDWHK